jgi:hypothetical protein
MLAARPGVRDRELLGIERDAVGWRRETTKEARMTSLNDDEIQTGTFAQGGAAAADADGDDQDADSDDTDSGDSDSTDSTDSSDDSDAVDPDTGPADSAG